MSEYSLNRLNEQNIRVNINTTFLKNNSNLNLKNTNSEASRQVMVSSDSANSLGSSDGLAAGISSILNGLEQINSNAHSTEDFNLSTDQREALQKNVGNLLENLDKVSNSKEFSEIKEQLDTLNLKLNINSPEEKEFIRRFNETQIIDSI
jgi:chaperonin cofactor prefoldin